MDTVKGWKTMAFGALLAVLGFAQQADWASVVPAEYSGLVVGVVGLLVMWLRSVTDTPVGDK